MELGMSAWPAQAWKHNHNTERRVHVENCLDNELQRLSTARLTLIDINCHEGSSYKVSSQFLQTWQLQVLC